jgi:large subunit ribosomal protein L5
MASVQAAPPARLKVRYLEEIRPSLMSRFGYTSLMQAPRLEKITLNMGVGMAKQDSKVLRAATEQLATIAGQHPSVRRARKSIAAFKLREGNPVGVAVTLRGDRSYEFLDRLISIAIPRIRDFRGLNPRSFDGRGNYSLGVREQIIFPEVDYDAIDQVRGLDITITTSAITDPEAFALLAAFGLPFSADRRPKGFEADVPARPDASGSSKSAAAASAPVEDAATVEDAAPVEDGAAVKDEAPAAPAEDEATDAPAKEEAAAVDDTAPAAADGTEEEDEAAAAEGAASAATDGDEAAAVDGDRSAPEAEAPAAVGEEDGAGGEDTTEKEGSD